MPGGFGVVLDDRPVRLPSGAVLTVPTKALAAAIAAEWAAPGPEITPALLHLTPLAGAALDRIAPDPASVRSGLLAYGRADLLCYRAADPASLAAHQHQSWQPWLDWAEASTGARLTVTHGIIAVDQPAAALDCLADRLAALDCWTLAGLGVIVPALGSLVLGLAVAGDAIAPSEAHALAMLDETWQERNWGADPETLARRTLIAAEIASAAMFVKLARP